VRGGHDAALMVLERCWREPVGAISDESLLREGYATFADFRRYYKLRTTARSGRSRRSGASTSGRGREADAEPSTERGS
jgi:hypothetical protein